MNRVAMLLRGTIYGVMVLLVGGALCGWIYQAVAQSRDDERFPPLGQRFNVYGHLMHLYCQGEGSPTIIVEQGIGAQSLGWSELNERMSRITRVCAYDRVGMGYSEPVGHATSSTQVAQNLNALLYAASIDDDVVLVGWSAGGMYARKYYEIFPERVKGMVLVDSSHEQQTKRMPANEDEPAFNPIHAYQYLAPLGWMRVSGQVDRQFSQSPLPPPVRDRLKAIWLKSHTFRTLVFEGEGFERDLARADAPPKLNDLPLVVLAQGKPNNSFMQQNLAAWHGLQGELKALSSNSKLVIASNSAHGIHRTEPELIAGAVNEVVDAVRSGARIAEGPAETTQASMAPGEAVAP